LSKEKEEAELFEGIRGVQSALYALIADAKAGDAFLFFSADAQESNTAIQQFYERFDAKRKEKGLKVKGLAPKTLRGLYEKRASLQMRFVDFPLPENTGLCGDKMAIITWGKKPRAILIRSKAIVEKQKRFFEQLWARA